MYDDASPMAIELLYLRGICCFAAVHSLSHMVLKLVLTEELKPFTITLLITISLTLTINLTEFL